MSELVLALGLVLFLEGLLYAAFPGGMKQALRSALECPDGTLRAAGLAACVLGLAIVWAVRG